MQYEISSHKQARMEQYLKAVLEVNKKVNLTRIDSFKQGLLLHIEDSLGGLPEFMDAPLGPALDLGSGGGFPGVPLSLAAERPIVLLDSVEKKVKAVRTILSDLNLGSSISAQVGRAEERALKFPSSFSVIVARAVSSLPSLCELASPLLHNDGQLICYKSNEYRDELEQAKAISKKVAMKFVSARELVLSDDVTERTIIVFEKSGEPTVKLPRRPGMAQKRPYKE